SPDGLKLVCGLVGIGTGPAPAFVYSFESRSYERLGDFDAAVWLGDSRRLLMGSGDGRLLLIDSISKKTREVLSFLPDWSGVPRLSHDNRQIFFRRESDQSDVYLLTFK